MKTFFLSLFFLPVSGFAEWDFKSEVFWTGRAREIKPNPLFLEKENQDQFFYLREEITYQQEHWLAKVSPFVVVANSRKVKQGPSPLITPIYSSRKQMNLESRYDNDPYTRTALDFQELYAGWNQEAYSLELGRRILSLGNLKLVPAWNKFNPIGASFRPTWIMGVDQVKMVHQDEKSKFTLYGILDQNRLQQAQLLQYDFFLSPFQISFLGGDWWGAHSAGLSSTYDFEGWLFKLESLVFDYFGVYADYETQTQTGAGVERSFAQDWSINVEFFFQPEGAITPHRSLKGESYLAGELKWTPDSFYTYQWLWLYSSVDQSSLQGLVATKQWSENTEVSLGLFVPRGEGEFSPTVAPSQLDLTLKCFF